MCSDTQPRKFLKKLQRKKAGRIIDRIDAILTENPISQLSKPIVGEQGIFRIRIGEYRALYRIEQHEKKVIVFRIEKRSKVYRKGFVSEEETEYRHDGLLE